MHDKFIVRYENGHDKAVLMGSANFTPEALSSSAANLLHIVLFHATGGSLRHSFPPVPQDVMSLPKWVTVNDLSGTTIRVFFSPDQG